jgi:succinate-semialdehyde dehydrogenase / glutarate-semialdehyde dehydrogenase
MSTIEIRSPINGNLIKTYEEMSEDEINTIVNDVFCAFQDWKLTSFKIRRTLIKKVADILRGNLRGYAEIMMLEMGKPIKGGMNEIEKCAWCCDFFAENAENFLSTEQISTEMNKSYVVFQPLGVVFAIMPWNFPFWQVFRFAAPNLMAGNAGLLKHASNTTGCAFAIEEIFKKAGFPENIFRILLLDYKAVDAVITHNKVAAVTLTGSIRAGKIVGSTAGSCVKKIVLELGGSDPYLILEDANLAKAAFIVVESIRRPFEELFVKKMSEAKMGDPAKEDTDVGPQARYDLRDQLHQQVEESLKKGATCLLGGVIPDCLGAYYPPTVLTNVKPGMPAYSEELFGPVASIIPVSDEDEAIHVANDTEFGLGAAIFTQDIKKGEDIAANKLQAGSCFVNGLVKSDPRMPFGGIKQSGYGRELSYYGIREFVNIKSVIIVE